tara:strand:+ start:347 stop:1024 length:678 start_codon:yes stop_codon:yes gene_type:complete
MENLKPNLQRAKNAVILIWVVLTIEIISLISGYLQYDLLQTVANGGEISIDTANANDTREQIIGIVYLVTYIISAITFIQWFRRAYYNLHLQATHLSQTEGWAAGSWFVPIICLYRPYHIMKELHQRTKLLLLQKEISIPRNFNIDNLGWWWTLWIVNNLIGQFVFRYSMKATSVEELTTSTVAAMIANIVGIPLALITIKIIKDYSTVETLIADLKEKVETLNV